MEKIVVIGGGVAGYRATEELIKIAPRSKITILHAEAGVPYDRPPLSKDYLISPEPVEPVLNGVLTDAGPITLMSELTVRAIERQNGKVLISDGRRLDYDKLLIATGSRSRILDFPAKIADRIHYLRTMEDARRLRAALRPGQRCAVIGAGFIGLEVSAAARHRGCSTVLFERASRILDRVASERLSDWLLRQHLNDHATVILSCGTLNIDSDGEDIVIAWRGGSARFDLIVVGIGVLPNTELAEEAGLTVDDGIVVDHACRTSDPNIFAAGEVTSYPVRTLGRRLRSESWSAACDQAKVAARSILGMDVEYDELPWLWSDQCGANVQCLGVPSLAAEKHLLATEADDKWLEIGLDSSGALTSAIAVNMGREMSMLRRASRKGEPLPQAITSRLRKSMLPCDAAKAEFDEQLKRVTG